jgi:AraC-like DNA-binding protein
METENLQSNDTSAMNEKIAESFQSFQALLDNKDMFFQFLDMFPYTIMVYAPDGTGIFINRAGCKELNIADQNNFVGRHNVHHDPMIDMLGFRDVINQVFQGGTATAYDIRVPYQDLSEKYDEEDESFNKIKYQDIFGYPLFDENDQIAYVIALFVTKLTYQGKAEIIKAQEYMEHYWLEDFDLDKIAQSVNLSRRHFQRMFKEVTDETPYDCYKRIKINKLKEKLLDPNLSVSEAFAACGVESKGTWFNAFKDATGVSPSDFRKQK